MSKTDTIFRAAWDAAESDRRDGSFGAPGGWEVYLKHAIAAYQQTEQAVTKAYTTTSTPLDPENDP